MEKKKIDTKDNVKKPQNEPFLKKGLDTFGNMFALNLCFVISSIPLFTIGASMTALYAMCIRLQENEEETVVAGYIHEFKRNFKQATKAYALVILAVIVMLGEYVFIRSSSGSIAKFYKGVLVTEVILFSLTIFFLFPLIARFENTLIISMRNSLILSVTYLGSWIKVAVAWVAPITFCVIYPDLFLFIWYFWFLLIFGMIAYGTTGTMRKIFNLNTDRIEEAERKAREEEEEEDDEDDEDEESSKDEEADLKSVEEEIKENKVENKNQQKNKKSKNKK